MLSFHKSRKLTLFCELHERRPHGLERSALVGLCLQRSEPLPQAQLEPLAKVGGSLSMYIPHVTGGNVLCWANVRVIRSLYEA